MNLGRNKAKGVV